MTEIDHLQVDLQVKQRLLPLTILSENRRILRREIVDLAGKIVDLKIIAKCREEEKL